VREIEDAIQNCGTLGFETLTFALSFCVRCRSASTTALSLGVSEEEEKLRSFQKLKAAAQVTKEVYASVLFHDLRLSSDILSAYHLILV
jgi:hypothetical protein